MSNVDQCLLTAPVTPRMRKIRSVRVWRTAAGRCAVDHQLHQHRVELFAVPNTKPVAVVVVDPELDGRSSQERAVFGDRQTDVLDASPTKVTPCDMIGLPT